MGTPEVQAFFRLLALCHTVMPEEKTEGKRVPSRTLICLWCLHLMQIFYTLNLTCLNNQVHLGKFRLFNSILFV